MYRAGIEMLDCRQYSQGDLMLMASLAEVIDDCCKLQSICESTKVSWCVIIIEKRPQHCIDDQFTPLPEVCHLMFRSMMTLQNTLVF